MTPLPSRADGRQADQLRDISLTAGANPHAEGSCLVKFGRTEVLVTASVQPKVPQWLKSKGQGWITAEYGMLPRATQERKDREAVRGRQEGRTMEIQRLIGRTLRSVCDLTKLGDNTLWLDCDVLVADGGTRTAAITGAYVALALAIRELVAAKACQPGALKAQVAAVSCGWLPGGAVLDMTYAEDSTALADANFVRASTGGWLELQVSAEQAPLDEAAVERMKQLATAGIDQLFTLQRQIIAAA